MRREQEKKRPGEPARKRKPYQPPRVETEEVFETLALACGKIGNTTFNCSRLNKNS